MSTTSPNVSTVRPKKAKRQWRRLVYAGVFILSVMALRSTVADWNDVLSGSMEPSIISGDRLLVNKIDYHLRIPFTDHVVFEFAEPERGDVIVFDTESGERMIKRVIGVPGDTISLRRNQLIINGDSAAYEPYEKDFHRQPVAGGFRQYQAVESIAGRKYPVLLTPGNPGPSFYPRTVPTGQVFVLGDNRDNSEDSRFFGAVPIQRIIGRVTHVVVSLDHENRLKPRRERFWTPLP